MEPAFKNLIEQTAARRVVDAGRQAGRRRPAARGAVRAGAGRATCRISLASRARHERERTEESGTCHSAAAAAAARARMGEQNSIGRRPAGRPAS
jgi:hypothetical protein